MKSPDNLKDLKTSRAYLRRALRDGGLDRLLKALREVAAAVDLANLPKSSKLTLQSVYEILSENGDPHARSLWQFVGALGLKFDLVEGKKPFLSHVKQPMPKDEFAEALSRLKTFVPTEEQLEKHRSMKAKFESGQEEPGLNKKQSLALLKRLQKQSRKR